MAPSGVAIGLIAAFVLTRLMANMLFGIRRSRPSDISGRGIFLESGCHPRQLRSRVPGLEAGSHIALHYE